MICRRFCFGGDGLDNRQPHRLTWGGLLRVLHRERRGSDFSHEHVRLIYPDGHRDFLNIRYDETGYPHFFIVKDKRRY